MKAFSRYLLKYYLKLCARLALLFHRPKVIAVAGSVNKYFFKEEIARLLRAQGFSVRCNPKDFNTAIGLPLAILDLPSAYHSYWEWLPILWRAAKKIFDRDWPEWLVLELGVSDKGEMKYLFSIAKPKIVVITEITQRYLEAFSDMDELGGEYEYLARRVVKKGLLVLNYDNSKVRQLAAKAKSRVVFFSLSAGAAGQENIGYAKEITKLPVGQKITTVYKNQEQDFEIKFFGEHHVQALLAGEIIQSEIAAK
jgi:UDP-N-acetylmuramoyl-tripeptide--D-alanyl-D-alanine ligase